MKCPICQGHSLRKHQLEADLPAYQCHKCEGIWISAAQYWEWQKARDEDAPSPDQVPDAPIPIEGDGQVKQCPECRHMLRRFQVWPRVQVYVDRCGHCDSIWFDKGEWAYVRSKGEHGQVHLFFTEAWQEKVRAEEKRLWLDGVYAERFGAEDYARIKEIREWLWQHPKQAVLMAFLTDRDPYRVVSK